MRKNSLKRWIRGLLPYREEDGPVGGFECQVLQKEEESWCEAEAQIVNHLIHMDSLMRIAKKLDYYNEYITLEQINEVLCRETIDLALCKKSLLGGLYLEDPNNQRRFATKPLPFQYYSLRSLLWKINLGYLPNDLKQKWVSSMEKNLLQYRMWIADYIISPVEKKLGEPSCLRRKSHEEKSEAAKKDHPLNFSQQSKWKNYFKDKELWVQIQKDTKRTRRNCHFFEEEYCPDLEDLVDGLRTNHLSFTGEQGKKLAYEDGLTRIIFIYLKNHPEDYYSQGMNEFAALILYCFTNKNSEYFRRVSESDSYFVFEDLMKRLPKKHFQKGEDYVKRFNAMLRKLDFRLHEEIERQGGTQILQMLTMRWFLTGFLNELPIDDCLLLWDSNVGWPDSETPLCDRFMYMGLAMIHLHRERIMEGENIAVMLSKVAVSAVELGEKSINLFRLFPKLIAQ